MSQEQPPVRSRRELRQARDERLEAGREPGTAAPGAVDPASKSAAADAAATPATPVDPGEPTPAEITGRSRRVADGPVDSLPSPGGSERSSQVRARDRAALRTIKELAEKEGQLAAGGPPTRRQLRLMQLAAETAPATAANLIVPASPRTRANPVVGAPAGSKPGAKPGGTPVAKPAAAKDEPATGQAPAAAKGKKAAAAPAADGQLPDGMTVEQALAARELLARQAENQLAKMDHIVATDPDAVDPDVLAEQIALAERAAG